MKDQLLIDGDEYLFKACAAVEREVRWDDQNHVLYCNRNEAWDNFTRLISQLFERFGTRDHLLCFSGAQPYFRHVLSPGYKPGRSRKPLCYSELRELCSERYAIVSLPALEADDVMGILSTQPSSVEAGRRRIIISQDKDMLGVPGWLSRDGRELQCVKEYEADHFHMMQTLMGDKTDGYSGLPGCGPVKAEKLLQEAVNANAHLCGTVTACLWPPVVKAYEKAGLTEADALLQARLARILRWSDWDREKKEPVLWSPGSP